MTTNTNAALAEDLQDTVSKALRRAWQLGQTYWQQADSEYTSQHRKADETQGKFDALVEETRAALSTAAQPPALTGDMAEPRDDSDRIYDRPVGYLPAYELSRLHSGHGAQLRSAKFGPSALDGDVPVYLESSALALVQALIGAQRAINSMKVEAETAAQGDEQMMLDACEQISNEGLEASLAIQAALSAAAQGDALPREDFAWMVVQEACETEPADEDDPECIRILRRDLKSAVLAAFLREDAARAAKEGDQHG